MIELESVRMKFPEDTNIIVGQTHFIKTAEDMYEAVVNTVPQAKFGLAFNESSGPCLTRAEGNDEELRNAAIANAQARVELRGYAEEQAALRRVAVLVARAAPPEEVFAAVTAEVGGILEVDLTGLGRYGPEDRVTIVGLWNGTGVALPTPAGACSRRSVSSIPSTAGTARSGRTCLTFSAFPGWRPCGPPRGSRGIGSGTFSPPDGKYKMTDGSRCWPRSAMPSTSGPGAH